MAHAPIMHGVHKALHRPLTIWGVERKLFGSAMLMGGVTFNISYSLAAGLLIFGVMYGFALWATKRDYQMLRIIMRSSGFKVRYDPLKHEPFAVEIDE